MSSINGKAADLLKVFQLAILDLSVKLQEEKSTMAPEDVESTNYVIGMATINSLNLEQIIQRGARYGEANKEKIERFLEDAAGFANALQQHGFGLVA